MKNSSFSLPDPWVFNVLLVFIIGIGNINYKLKAQELQYKNEKYSIELDSQIIKASSYDLIINDKNEIHFSDNLEWYNDAKVYRFYQKISMKMVIS